MESIARQAASDDRRREPSGRIVPFNRGTFQGNAWPGYFLSNEMISLVFLLLCLCAYGFARKAAQSARSAQDVALLAANLEGQLAQSEKTAERMTEIAKHAIECAAEAAQLEPEEVWRSRDSPSLDVPIPKRNYVSPQVKFCRCNVSIRSDKWPQPCPACGQMVGDILDSEILE